MEPAIGDHALLADGRTAALLDDRGNIAWLCWPRVDSPPCLLAILDPAAGGVLSLRPSAAGARPLSRRYLPRSLALETVWQVDGARATVTEALAWRGPPRLLRVVRGTAGDLAMVATFRPAFDAARAAVAMQVSGLVAGATGGGLRLAAGAPAPWVLRPDGVAEARFSVAAGATCAMVVADPQDVAGADAEGLLAATLEHWRSALAPMSCSLSRPAERALGASRAEAAVALSAAVLVGLRQRDGGIVAAPTTSLPQWPGGSRTWDYRYSWLRDSSLAALALDRVGLVDEARGLGGFVGEVAAAGARALVRVDGSPAPEEVALGHLAGHGGAGPVRLGNAAARQPQLDVTGEVIEMAAALARRGELPAGLRRAVPVLADAAAGGWTDPDHGIWEIRGRRRRYTHSRLLAWFGLERAAGLARAGSIAGDAGRWEATARRIRRAVLAGDGPLQLHRSGGGADAALALVPLLGLLGARDPRVAATLDLILARLVTRGLVNRHEAYLDLAGGPCAPFVFPTFWLACALEACGRDGDLLLGAACATAGSTGLLGEVADPDGPSPLGNYPQVQSHAALILGTTVAPTPW